MAEINKKLTELDLQNEIDRLIGEEGDGHATSSLERGIIKELRAELPTGESVELKKGKDTEIIVKSDARSGGHSPFVLDLSKMIAKKKSSIEKKEEVRKAVRMHLSGTLGKAERTKQLNHIVAVERSVVKPKKSIAEKPSDYSGQFTQKRFLPRFYLPYSWRKNLFVFLIVGLIFVAPIKLFSYYADIDQTKDQVVEYANSAYGDLKQASAALADNDLGGATAGFLSAEDNFSAAVEKVEGMNAVLKTILEKLPTGTGNLADAENLLTAGQTLSSVAGSIPQLFDELKSDKDISLTEKLAAFEEKLNPLLGNLHSIRQSIERINPEIIAPDNKFAFENKKNALLQAITDLEEVNQLSKSLDYILGKDTFRRYLVVFQNNNELRPSGGFLGSFALVDIDRGEIKNIEIPGGGTYDLQGQLLAQVNAPAPLTLVNPKWEFQDANWFPDFPSSAQKIKWFYEKAGGATVDGVIAINATLVPKLIEATEPINLVGYDKTLTAANFITETQKAVQFEYDKVENKPKQILSDMAPVLLENIFKQKGEKVLEIAKLFKTALDEKEIQMYFVNESVEQKFAEYSWTGEMKDASRDYLSVVNANIRGSKSDQFITQNVNLYSEISESGEIINTVSVTRTHTGRADDLFGKDSNIDYLRFYVPENSELLFASGFSEIPESAFEKSEVALSADQFLTDIQGVVSKEPRFGMTVNEEFNKQVFGNWLQVDAGESKTVVVKYKLPFAVNFNLMQTAGWFGKDKKINPFHSLLLQKQSGVQNIDYTIEIETPFGKSLTWKYPESANTEANVYTYKTTDKKDELLAIIIE